jgi:hypothetical protein
MEMKVEVCLIEDGQEIITDSDVTDDWKEKVEELGLEGQMSLIDGDDDSSTTIPFPVMTREEAWTYKELLPSKSNVEQFRHGVIPLRVLSVIALAKQQNYFSKIEIWYSAADPDPVAVGYANDAFYMIGRWGPELESFMILKQKAVEKLRTRYLAMLNKAQALIDVHKNAPDDAIFRYLNRTFDFEKLGSDISAVFDD